MLLFLPPLWFYWNSAKEGWEDMEHCRVFPPPAEEKVLAGEICLKASCTSFPFYGELSLLFWNPHDQLSIQLFFWEECVILTASIQSPGSSFFVFVKALGERVKNSKSTTNIPCSHNITSLGANAPPQINSACRYSVVFLRLF